MACERRVWRHEGCDHEEVLDVRCGLSADPDHVHNTVVVETDHPPRCSICNPPPPIDEDVARDLVQAAVDRHLPAPGSRQSIVRGAEAETLAEEQTSSNVDNSLPIQNGATVNGAAVNGTSRHSAHRSLDTHRNVPASGPGLHAVQTPSGSPVQGVEDEESSQRETDSNMEQ
ncbi:MAG: hypothetical protein LQ343_001049 [Gyalolechia ehrenbergii]|nr:MAG: hypothetical protein LQ343_001049 [Gyalolechia ehrenbergii]